MKQTTKLFGTECGRRMTRKDRQEMKSGKMAEIYGIGLEGLSTTTRILKHYNQSYNVLSYCVSFSIHTLIQRLHFTHLCQEFHNNLMLWYELQYHRTIINLLKHSETVTSKEFIIHRSAKKITPSLVYIGMLSV
jgi:hypothetical protein